MKHACLLLLITACLPGRSGLCLEPAPSAGSKDSKRVQSTTSTLPSEETVRIKGLVKGPKGPLPGAVVQLKGTSTLVVTAEGGKFELDVPTSSPMVELTCSYAGLQDAVMKLSINSPLAVIEMKPAIRVKVEPAIESGWW